MKVLAYGNRKTDGSYWLADTPERLSKAYWKLFEELEYWQVFDDGEEDSNQKFFYNKAQEGDEQSLIKLLNSVKGYEYCEWSFIEVEDPMEN